MNKRRTRTKGRAVSARSGGRSGNGRSGSEEVDTIEGRIRRFAADGTIAAAASEAIRAQRAAGLAITYKKGNLVIKEYPDGRTEVLDRIPPAPAFKRPRGVSLIKSK